MAKLTVGKVAKRCLEISKQLNPRLDDPRLQDLRVSIEQARRAIKEGQLPRWQVKRLVDTVALAAMLTGNAKLAEQVFGLWMKSGQSISQNPASLVLEPLSDLGKKSEGASPEANPGQPAGQALAEEVDNSQSSGMGLAAMVSAAYAAENDSAQNPTESAGVKQSSSKTPAPQPAEAKSKSDQSNPKPVATAPAPAVSANAEWSASRGQMPWLPVQRPAPAPDRRGEVEPAPAADIDEANSSQVKPETSPGNVLAPGSEFPPRRSLARRDFSPQSPTLASSQIRPAPAPPADQPLPSAAPPKPAAPAPPATVTPAAAPTEVAPTQAPPLDDAAIWDYFQKMGFDSKLNMSFEEFVARKNHTVSSNAETGSNLAAHPATQPEAPRSAFAEVPDEMPASLLASQSEPSESALAPAESALRRAAQSPLAPSRVPPAAPHKPREILADADRQPSTRLITIRVRGYFDYQPRFTRPKQRLDEPAVAGSTTSFAKSIISAEGPMPLEFLARRLCQKYRIEYHEQRPEEISRCLGSGLRLISEPGMRTVWPAGVNPLNWNTALQSPIGLPRKLESLTLTEVANALRWQISRTNSMERTEIIGEAFKLLYGISPLTTPARQLADRAISYGIANNLLEAGNDTLWLP